MLGRVVWLEEGRSGGHEELVEKRREYEGGMGKTEKS